MRSRNTSARRGSLRAALVLAALCGVGYASSATTSATPVANACGACLCDDEATFVYPNARDVAINARIFVHAAGVTPEAVRLRVAGSDALVATHIEPAGPDPADGLWLVPDAPLEPATEYVVDDLGSFTTGATTDETPPEIAAAEIVTDVGTTTLRAVCDEKLGAAVHIEPVTPQWAFLVQIDVIAASGERTRALQRASNGQVIVGRWLGDAATWGKACLGEANVPWMTSDEAFAIEVVMFDEAGNASAPVRFEGVRARRVGAPGCDSDASGCSVAR